MKVALVASSFSPEPGRLERRVDELARGLARRGTDVEILTQGRGTPGVEQFDRVTIRRFPTVVGRVRFPVAPKLREHLRLTSQTFDVVDVHTRHASLALAVSGSRMHRFVLTPNVPFDAFRGWPQIRATRAILTAATQIVCRSEGERDLLCNAVPSAARRTEVVGDGVDALALGAAEPFVVSGSIVLSVDRLDRATGVGRAIAALPSLDREFRLVVAGDGPARDRLVAFAVDLRTSSRVDFVGAVPDAVLYRWLRTARVVVTLASERSSGSLLTEALAAGVAVVASDLPVHRRIAERLDAEHVIFVAPRASPLDVADAIEEAGRLPTIRSAEWPRHPVQSWESVVDSTWRLYQLLAEGALDSARDRAGGQVRDSAGQLADGATVVAPSVISLDARGQKPSGIGALSVPEHQRFKRRVNGARRWR